MTTYRYVTPAELNNALLVDRSYSGLNSNAYAFPKWKVGAWKGDGSVTLADCTNPQLRRIVGLSNASIPSGQRGLFVQRGTVEGAIATLGASPGDTVYLDVPAGQLTLTAPTGQGVVAIRIGYAEQNATSGLVTDLLLDFSVALSDSGGGSGGGTQTQTVYNSTGSDIPAFRAVSWLANSTVEAGDALANPNVAGITTQLLAAMSYDDIQTTGIIQGALVGLGAQAGDPVFLAEGAGGFLALGAPTDLAATVIRIGHAVPRTGTHGNADDLLLDIQQLVTP